MSERVVPAARLRLRSSSSVTAIGPSLKQLLADPTPAALAHFLAAVKVLHKEGRRLPAEFQGDVNVPVPVEVIALLGEHLITSPEWAYAVRAAEKWRESVRKPNAKRHEDAVRRAAAWQAQADEIRQRHPDWLKTRIAKRIDPKKFNTIRQRIVLPKK